MSKLAPWERKCIRCSMLVRDGGSQICRRCFDERADAVYCGSLGECIPACRAGGPHHAECLLPEEHDAPHEGNGFDDYGPMYQRWNDRTKRAAAERVS